MSELTILQQEYDVDTKRWFPDAVIPFLKPYGLEIVPGYRLNPDGTEDLTWRTDWFEWRDQVFEVREKKEAKNETSDLHRERERVLAYNCPHYFKAMYGWIAEPRPRKGEHTHKPFIPFHYQVHLTNARRELLADPDEQDFWNPKSRGLGVSWNNQWDEIWYWLATDSRWILASRNEALVADIDNVDAMFGKVFYGLRRIPGFLLPRGFDPHNPRKWWNSTRMLLTNLDRHSPGYGSQLVGSPTTKSIGRAGRYTGADVDEAQKIPKLNAVLQSLRGSTFHIYLTGTESTEEGEDFPDGWQSQKREDPRFVYELNFHQNAYQDPDWLERQKRRATTPQQKADLALEYERNYFAGYGDWVYPEARLIAEDDLPYRADVPLDTTIDPGKDDETAVLVCQPTLRDGVPGFHVLFTWEKQLTNSEWVAHVLTGIWPEEGKDSCYGIRPTPEEEKIGAFYYKLWIEARETRWFADPAAGNRLTNDSFLLMFQTKTEELRQRENIRLRVKQVEDQARGIDYNLPPVDPFGITLQIMRINEGGNRRHDSRHRALRKYLPATTIQTGVISAMRFRTCLMRYQFNPRSPKAVTEAVPLHNQYSHLASTGEYYATYYLYGFIDPPAKKTGPKMGPGVTRIPSGYHGGIPSNYSRKLPMPPAKPPDRGYRRPPATSPTGRWR